MDDSSTALAFELTGVSAWRAPSADVRPTASMLASSARRRATPLELVVAEVADALLDLPAQVRERARIVLGSRFGELSATETILDSLTNGDGRVSPAAFSSSVHNASLGLVSIARGIQAGSIAMSGGEGTAHLCLVEAAALLREDDAPVIVILADEAPLAGLGQTGRFPLAAVGLRLARAVPRRSAADVATLIVMPPRRDGVVGGSPDDDTRDEPDAPSSVESPAWWPLRAVFAETPSPSPEAAAFTDEVAAMQRRLSASSLRLTSGRRGRRDDVAARVTLTDDADGVGTAHRSLPHEPPARVVGFPAWWTAHGLVCTVSPEHGDPFVVSPAPNTTSLVDDCSEHEPAATAEERVVDGMACLEWIAQAAAWCGARPLLEHPGPLRDRRAGALLATRSLRLEQRWLPLEGRFRVEVRRVAEAEGLARYEGTVTCERGLRVASADVLVRISPT